MNNNLKHFCNNVATLRKKHNLSQKKMAKICHIGVGSLRKIEQGILPARLSADIMFAIQRHFQIPIHKLFGTELF